ncbi:hypothetical protein HY045_01325 [Candidatus Woesebacteria bacterium]|nr:hypothetical protein [Candidatus Woesebacteria bacterium]
MTKYKEYVQKMLDQNKEVFDGFRTAHDKYSFDAEKWQEEFNKVGGKVLTIVQEYENKLCLQSEKAGYGNYTKNLSEKFRAELKKHFPMIDHVGVIVKKVPDFAIKKIILH